MEDHKVGSEDPRARLLVSFRPLPTLWSPKNLTNIDEDRELTHQANIFREWALGTRLHPSASSSHTTAERRWKIWNGTATICCLTQDHLDRLNNQVRKYRIPYQHYNWPRLIDCLIALNQVELVLLACMCSHTKLPDINDCEEKQAIIYY